jgi:hypothetical protein
MFAATCLIHHKPQSFVLLLCPGTTGWSKPLFRLVNAAHATFSTFFQSYSSVCFIQFPPKLLAQKIRNTRKEAEKCTLTRLNTNVNP